MQSYSEINLDIYVKIIMDGRSAILLTPNNHIPDSYDKWEPDVENISPVSTRLSKFYQ